jgi:sodium transport system permease protein
MWRHIVTVARKELREALRDRRSLGSGLFYGVWGPLVMAMALLALARQHGPEAPITVSVDGQAHAASLMRFLADRSVIVVRAAEGVERDVRERRVPVALIVHDAYPDEFSTARPAKVTLLFEGSWATSRTQADRVRALLGEYSRRVGDDRLVLRGVSPAVTMATHVIERDLSTAPGRAATVLATLPIFLLLAAFVGSMGLAADVMAGERERGSLEALLTHPVPRPALVAGKWAATVLVGLTTVGLTLSVSQVVLTHPRLQAFDLPIGLSLGDAARISGFLVPLTLMIAALQILVALFARSYKEAHTHLSLMIFLPMVPGFLFAFGSLTVQSWMSWVPMLGQHLMIGDIMRGQVPAAAPAAALTLITLVATAVLLAATSALLGRESILRRLGG